MIRELELGAPVFIHLLWAVPLALLVCAWSVSRSERLLVAFGVDRTRFRSWMRAQARRRWLRTTIFSVAVALLGVAALRPRANPERTTFRREGRDLAIVLDVSRSMLAEDIRPSRLERAKLELDRLAEHLSGDRIGLIAFAGDAVIVCPLTSNYSYFRSTLKNLSVRSVSQGGTRIGDALRKALGDLLQVSASAPRRDSAAAKVGETLAEIDERAAVESRPADILLITDGEDHDSYPIHAAEQVRDAGVGLFILGIGSEEGTPIPVRGANGETRLLEHDGEIVRSRLDSSTLREMALKVPRGWYLPAGTQGFDLVEIHEDAIASEGGREIVEEHVSWTEIFQPFLLAGVALYFLFLLVSERTPSQLRERFAGLARETGSARAAPLAGVILMALFTPIALVADAKVARAQSALEQGAELFSKGDYVEAARAFEEGSDTKDLLLRKFNAGVSYLRANELDEALRRFEEVSSRANGELRDAARQNAAWCHFERGSKRFAAARALAKNSSDPAASTTHPSPDVAAATDDPLSAQLDEYRKAAESFRLALDLYRKLELGLVDDAAAASIARDVSVTKTALVAALDEVARLEEEIARREDEKMLEDPPAMIARILAIEKLHRGIARELAHAPRSERRIGARRLQRAEEENRRRAELLLHFLRERAEEARQAEEARASSRSSTSGGALESRVSELIAERRGMLGQGTLPDEMREKLEQEVILLEDLLSRIPRMSDEERTTLEKELDAMIASESGADAQMSGAAIKEAAEAVGRAVDAQLEAASRYAARSPGDAVRHHSTAIRELRVARTVFPIQAFALAREAHETQSAIVSTTRAIVAERGGDASLGASSSSDATSIDTASSDPEPGDTKPDSAAASTSEKTSSGTVTAIGRRLIDALKDKYLAPLARSLAPDRSRELVALADEEEEVAWVGSVLAAAEIPPIPATLGDPHQEAPQTPESDADREAREKEDAEAKARAETLREEAALVRDHANRAREAFSNQDAEGALAAAVEALDALERILELEPKAPISPEERLQRLVAQEKEAREAARGLETLEGETLDLGAAELGASQREAGKEAEEIATELEKRSSDERVVAAVGKVRDGSLAVFASAESLDRREPRPAGESIERAIALFEEALELLAREGESQDDQRERQNEELEQDDPSSRQAQPSQDSYTLSPRDARREIEEMDRKRRREEAKLFFESPGITVDKDW